MYAIGDGEQQPPSYSYRPGSRHSPAGGAVINIPLSSSVGPNSSTGLMAPALFIRHPSNVVASINHVQLLVLGIILTVLGLLSIVFNVVNICFIDQVGWVVYVTGNGFWCGCMSTASGGFCIAASRNKSRLLIAVCVLANMATSCLALQQLIVGVRGAVWAKHLCTYQRLLHDDYNCHVGRVTTAMEASLAAVAILAIIASVWSLVISCRALGCCALASVSQFGTGSSVAAGRDASMTTASAAASVVYHQQQDDVTTASSHAEPQSRYAVLY